MTKARKLDNREQLFVDYYCESLKPEPSAIKAGYAKTTARTKSHLWVCKSEQKVPKSKKHVWKAIQARLNKISEKAEINAEWLLRRLGEMADADLNDIYDEKGVLLPVSEMPLIWRQGLVAGLDVDELTEGSGKDRVVIGQVSKLKQLDRKGILEMIGKHRAVNAFDSEEKTTEIHVHLDEKDMRA